MAGQGNASALGPNAEVDHIDGGTSALMSTPAPGSVGSKSATTTATSSQPADAPMSGGIPYAIGQPSIVRIPIPGTGGLAIELTARGWTPKGGSTSTLFFQDPTGARHLRLDYGYNVRTKTIDYHWNQKGTAKELGITDHAPAGQTGKVAYQAAKYFKYAGRVLVVVGVAIDVVSVVQSSKPLRRASQAVAGWAGAWVGCKVVGAVSGLVGTSLTPIGTAVVGIGGCIVGGIGGYYGGSELAGEVYDWSEDTFFTPLSPATGP
jgi:hypothetical protein